jgi:hypothetical protein
MLGGQEAAMVSTQQRYWDFRRCSWVACERTAELPDAELPDAARPEPPSSEQLPAPRPAAEAVTGRVSAPPR